MYKNKTDSIIPIHKGNVTIIYSFSDSTLSTPLSTHPSLSIHLTFAVMLFLHFKLTFCVAGNLLKISYFIDLSFLPCVQKLLMMLELWTWSALLPFESASNNELT